MSPASLVQPVAFGSGGNIQIYEPKRDITTNLTPDLASTYPLWTPDGRYIVFQKPEGMSWTRSDGAIKPQSLTKNKGLQFPWSFTPDGKHLAFVQMSSGSGNDIWTAEVQSDERGLRLLRSVPFLQTNADERHPAFSPDGRWLAYTAGDSGTLQVYVRAFPDKGRKWQISNNGGTFPVWSRNGHELLFRDAGGTPRIMAASYTAKSDEFIPEKPRRWAEKQIAVVGVRGGYDASRDGKRIVALMPAVPAEQGPDSHLMFLLNFSEEIRRKIPAGK